MTRNDTKHIRRPFLRRVLRLEAKIRPNILTQRVWYLSKDVLLDS